MTVRRGRHRSRVFRRRTARLVHGVQSLGRRPKQVLMVLADLVAMPLALWTAIALRTGSVEHGLAPHAVLYAATIVSTVPFFIRIGLYRAVIRYLGAHAA